MEGSLVRRVTPPSPPGDPLPLALRPPAVAGESLAAAPVAASARPAAEPSAASADSLPALWRSRIEALGTALRDPNPARLAAAFEPAAAALLELLHRDPDLAIFQVVRHDTSDRVGYGISHSLRTGITACLAAQRLGWDEARCTTVFKAALTMNLSALELQDKLSMQLTPPSLAQREAIATHPTRSLAMLVAAGIDDREWLDAVVQHHEVPGGKGYPRKLQQVTPAACLIRQADLYAAKLSSRGNRATQPAPIAARDLCLQSPGDAMAEAIVDTFGTYPPGCHVAIASGEMGVVVRRGATAQAPIVAALANRHGDPLFQAVRRDTSFAAFAVTAAVSEHRMRVRVSEDQLVALARA